MPKLVRLYIRHTVIGFAIAAGFVALLLWSDIQGLRGLVAGSDTGVLAVFILWFMNGIVFAGVQFAWAVMSMAERGRGRPRGGRRIGLRSGPALLTSPACAGENRRP